jgi:hypothetical protein
MQNQRERHQLEDKNRDERRIEKAKNVSDNSNPSATETSNPVYRQKQANPQEQEQKIIFTNVI